MPVTQDDSLERIFELEDGVWMLAVVCKDIEGHRGLQKVGVLVELKCFCWRRLSMSIGSLPAVCFIA